MTLLVLAFGGSRDAVCTALRKGVGDWTMRVLVLRQDETHTFNYQGFDGGLEPALSAFAAGTFSSILILGGAHNCAGAFCPRFDGQIHEEWTGYVEGRDLSRPSIDDLLEIDGLSYITLSVEESPDFDVPYVTIERFPWPSLLAGAVRDRNRNWVIRRRLPKGSG